MLKSWKILLLFVLMFGLFTVVGCSDDEDEIVGTWKLYSEDGVVVNFSMLITLDSDGNFTVDYVEVGGDNYTENGTYSIDGSVISLDFGGGEVESSTFSLSGDTLTVTHDDNSVSVLKRQ